MPEEEVVELSLLDIMDEVSSEKAESVSWLSGMLGLAALRNFITAPCVS